MLKHNEVMSKHCSLRAGGIAKLFYTPDTTDALSDFLKKNNYAVLMLGLGSNLLIRESGFDGVIIHTKQLKQLTIKNSIIHAESGVTLAKLSRFSDTHQQNGAEFLASIPGSVGGALAMNAGAFGSEIWDFVVSVTTIDLLGITHHRDKNDFTIAYRSVLAKHENEYFISAEFQFSQPCKKQTARALLEKRNHTQPIGQASCGSVFKNPPNHYAAKLIEQANLKGFCVGGACISNKHANFIINKNNANANEVEHLIKHIQTTIKSRFNIDLDLELKII